MSHQRRRGLEFSQRELFDLVIAWIVLSVAFAIFFEGADRFTANPGRAVEMTTLSALTVGVGFMLHELAHKVVAVRFDQVAEFRADYGMLFLAVMGAIVGFIFAAPGAVHHRGRITKRQHGLVAVAGPLTNLVLVGLFAPLVMLDGYLGNVGAFGTVVNAFLAAFNMVPYGPLDGKTVKDWSTAVFLVTFLFSAALTVGLFLTIGFPSV